LIGQTAPDARADCNARQRTQQQTDQQHCINGTHQQMSSAGYRCQRYGVRQVDAYDIRRW
jgi:hypothetical protein